MFGFRYNDITISYDGDFFAVVCESGERRTLDNAAEARELFLGEVDRKMRRAVNDKLRSEGFNIFLGGKEMVE